MKLIQTKEYLLLIDEKAEQMVIFAFNVQEAMIEFAKSHLKAYQNKIEDIMKNEEQEKNSVLRIHNEILNAYSEENIK